MTNKPYKFSIKAGRYISKTQTGNREYYHELLTTIEPLADFDPNSTYGKHIMKKTLPELRKYKRTNQTLSEHKNSLSTQYRKLTQLQNDNQREEKFRKSNAIERRASEITVQKNPLVAFLKKRAFLISIAIGLIAYFNQEQFSTSFWVFIGSYVVLDRLMNLVFGNIKKSQLEFAELELSGTDFGHDLREKEWLIKKEIEHTNEEIKKLDEQLLIIEEDILNIAQELLNEDKLKFILSDHFYNSTDWKRIRDQAFAAYENICVKCGSTEGLAADHIYPRSKFPEKALELSNTQILCLRCNSSKGNRVE